MYVYQIWYVLLNFHNSYYGSKKYQNLSGKKKFHLLVRKSTKIFQQNVLFLKLSKVFINKTP